MSFNGFQCVGPSPEVDQTSVFLVPVPDEVYIYVSEGVLLRNEGTTEGGTGPLPKYGFPVK